MTQPATTLTIVFFLLVSAGCEGQRYKPAAWDAAPRVKDAGIEDSDTTKAGARIPPLPEVTDWMSPGSPKRRIGSARGGYRGNANSYRGNAGPYRGMASPYRGNTNSYRGNVNPRQYNNPLRPYRGNAGDWRGSSYRGDQMPRKNSSERNGPYRGY